MSLKENIDAIKEELTAEEKFLESVIKSESFYKKYKKTIIGVVAAVILGVVASMTYNYLQEQNAKAANELYLSLISGKTTDKTSLEQKLKSKNPKLFELYLVHTALQSGDTNKLNELKQSVKDPILKEMISYQLASIKEDGFLKYIGQGDVVLKDFAYIDAGYKALESGDRKKAEDIFGFISPASPLYRVVQSLKHYVK